MTNEVLHALGRLALGFFCIFDAVWVVSSPIGAACLCFLAGTCGAIGSVWVRMIRKAGGS